MKPSLLSPAGNMEKMKAAINFGADAVYLAGKTLDEVEEKAYLGTLEAHVDGDVPVITMEMGELTPAKLGEMFYFFELSCGISAYMLGVNPFDQPGVEHYKRNMFRLLGKPGYEK